jgi:hypothetical protein
MNPRFADEPEVRRMNPRSADDAAGPTLLDRKDPTAP